jgi:hypothetical protein
MLNLKMAQKRLKRLTKKIEFEAERIKYLHDVKYKARESVRLIREYNKLVGDAWIEANELLNQHRKLKPLVEKMNDAIIIGTRG